MSAMTTARMCDTSYIGHDNHYHQWHIQCQPWQLLVWVAPPMSAMTTASMSGPSNVSHDNCEYEWLLQCQPWQLLIWVAPPMSAMTNTTIRIDVHVLWQLWVWEAPLLYFMATGQYLPKFVQFDLLWEITLTSLLLNCHWFKLTTSLGAKFLIFHSDFDHQQVNSNIFLSLTVPTSWRLG